MDTKLQTPDWAYWLNLSRVPIKAACALSCDIDPRSLPSNSSDLRDLPEYRRRYDWATNAIAAHTLDTETDVERANYYGGSAKGCEVVTLAGFRAWSESLPKPLTFPQEFPPAMEHTDGDSSADPWPWGTHETKLLRKLSAAAKRFWSGYDPADPSTANTNETVSEWLQSEGVAKRVAEVMAQILRADNLRNGPR